MRKGRFAFKGLFQSAVPPSDSIFIGLPSEQSVGAAVCLATGRSCCYFIASSFFPVEETINHR